MAKMNAKTMNGDNTFEHSGDLFVEFFSKAGSLFTNKKQTYYTEASALELFKPCWYANRELAMKLLFWVRNIRGGAGNRSGFRSILTWIANEDPEWIVSNMELIPKYGRWDDLESLYGTSVERYALRLWSTKIKEQDGLACKWAGRKDNKLRAYMQMTPKDYRKLLVNGTKVVEQKMCSGDWTDINYEHVPSKAMSLYSKAFSRNDAERFAEFKGAVVKGEKVIKTGTLFPHDCVRTVRHGDIEAATLQFKNLPNFVKNPDMRSIVICDWSGSMDSHHISNTITAMDVSIGMALYFSSRLSESNPFYKKFIAFSDDSAFIDWKSKSFSWMCESNNLDKLGSWSMSTNIERALKNIATFAHKSNIGAEMVPNTLIIVSDMQFNQSSSENDNSIESGLKEFDKYGYERPKIIYWNVAGVANSPDRYNSKKVGLVSGFSPSILSAIFANEDFTPYSIMMKTLEPYTVVIPTGEMEFSKQTPLKMSAKKITTPKNKKSVNLYDNVL